jgi:hypothetical protein
MAEETKRDAVVQFEIDRKTWGRLSPSAEKNILTNSPDALIGDLCRMWVKDTLNNWGTFVLVADEHKITVVQRPWSEESDE